MNRNRSISWRDIMEGVGIENPPEQLIFFVSRFLGISETVIGEMSIPEISPYVEELNEYFKSISLEYGFTMERGHVPPDPNSPNVKGMDRIETRWQILDI